MKTALTIAGSDTIGGAGIQADIKTMTVNGVYAMSVITALTAQNTLGVSGIMEVTPKFLSLELDAVFTDIFPDSVKIGMVSSAKLIETIADSLKKYKAENIVVDPVMVATSGSKLIDGSAVNSLCSCLLPLAALVTPNIPEAEILSGMSVTTENDMLSASRLIHEKYGCSVLCKGGHLADSANDLLYTRDGYRWFNSERINNPNTHGTGCTLSSAIAANLAKGLDIETSIKYAKEYLSIALSSMLNLGKGNGPLQHNVNY